MSADNWAMCPACSEKARGKRSKAIEKAEKSYGKIPVEEFLALRQEANKPMAAVSSLREDYELGIKTNGVFYVTYRGHCDICEFDFLFEHEQKVIQSETKTP